MTKYVVWNSARIAQYGFKGESLEDLQLLEFDTDLSWSSVVNTDDIESLIESVYNETNVSLSYALSF